MAFRLPDHWVWDFWLADDGERFHLFFLHAPKSLGDPHLRHRNARIGHASSPDLIDWTHHGRIFDAGPPGSFDDTATWTGSVVRGPDGLWRLFYTGSRFLYPDKYTNIETIGLATSRDLFTWEKQPGPVLAADPQFYETLGTSEWPEEAFRDPWVFAGKDGLWHMLITARGKDGPGLDRGVVGHATSPDLATWTAQPPLSATGSGFAHLEVFQLVEVGGRRHLVFCSGSGTVVGARAGQPGGTWSLPVGEVPGPIDVSKARLLASERYYAGRVAIDRRGEPWLMAFDNVGADGAFIGGIADPMPLGLDADGYLQVQKAESV